MRILAIRGENLASLAEPFELDFEAEPLRGAGLFAITGETGAGKSTLLDALCLALYDTFPRVDAEGANEATPDVSGEALAAKDARTILRRGAASGFAEADFLARDGRRYRARCAFHRVRGKASGRLKSRDRTLHEIDASGAPFASVASGIDEVRAKIVELLDLTFDQFCRTALLAQGEFDAFLRAGAKDRAALLEKITGTQIYAEISKRAYARARASARDAEELERRRADIGLLNDEALAALLEERAEIETQREILNMEREATAQAIARLDAIARAGEKLAAARAAQEAAEAQREALAPLRLELAAATRAESLRAPFDALRRCDAERARLAQESARATEAATQAQSLLEQATQSESAARDAATRCEDEWRRFEPIWTQAEILDAQLAQKTGDLAAAQEDATRAETLAAAKQRESEDAARALTRMTRQLQEARATLQALEPARRLAQDVESYDALLQRRGQGAAEQRAAQSRAAALATTLAQSAAEVAALEAALAQERAARAQTLAELDEQRAAFAALDESGARAEARRLDALAAAARIAGEAADKYRQAEARQRQARETGEAAVNEMAAATERLGALGAARGETAARKAEADRFGDIADAAASKAAEALRATLAPGAPCPVCGALDHPARAAHAHDEFLRAAQARRAELSEALARLDHESAQVGARLAAAEARRDEARRVYSDAARDMSRAQAEYGGARAAWPDAEAPPADIAAARAPLDALAETMAAQRASIEQRLDSAERLRSAIVALERRRDALHTAIETRETERARRLAESEAQREEAAQLAATLKAHCERLAEFDAQLAPALRACGLDAADIDRDVDAARARLAQTATAFLDAQRAAETLGEALARQTPATARLAAEAQAAEHLAETARAHCHSCAVAREELSTARAALLAGEATATHRARLRDARAAAAAALAAENVLRLERAGAAAAAQARADDLATEARAAAEQSRRALEEFEDYVDRAEMTRAEAERLLALAPHDLQNARERIAAADAACAQTASAARERAQDLDDLRRQSAPDSDADALGARAAELSQKLDGASQRLGEIAARLAEDAAARERAAALTQEISATAARRKCWDEINAAIGSADGDKFRRFAQGVTLERLVALANRGLADLAPRYQLERAAAENGDLGLQIVDREFCDERRSTRSLSGGERFLASLALALALAGLEGRSSFIDTLFIDEGFGSLDAATLDVAIDALERLQGQGRKVGVISHVDALQQRISTKVRVVKRGGGRSVLRIDSAS